MKPLLVAVIVAIGLDLAVGSFVGRVVGRCVTTAASPTRDATVASTRPQSPPVALPADAGPADADRRSAIAASATDALAGARSPVRDAATLATVGIVGAAMPPPSAPVAAAEAAPPSPAVTSPRTQAWQSSVSARDATARTDDDAAAGHVGHAIGWRGRRRHGGTRFAPGETGGPG